MSKISITIDVPHQKQRNPKPVYLYEKEAKECLGKYFTDGTIIGKVVGIEKYHDKDGSYCFAHIGRYFFAIHFKSIQIRSNGHIDDQFVGSRYSDCPYQIEVPFQVSKYGTPFREVPESVYLEVEKSIKEASEKIKSILAKKYE